MFWKKKKKPEEEFQTLYYSEAEITALESHIAKHFGEFKNVLHEIVSPDIHVDIAVIDPTPKRDYYTLVTMGMGAHRMNVPSEISQHRLERAEVMVCLPPDWDIKSHDEQCYWPLRWLKILARLPIENNTWLGWGHTIPNGAGADPFAENTKLGCIMLLEPGLFGQEAALCEMPDGSCVNFYQMMPLYADEMNYKLENNYQAESLLERISETEGAAPEDFLVVDINRPSILENHS